MSELERSEAMAFLNTMDQYDNALDDATHAVIAAFDGFTLPEGEQMTTLLHRLNDAIDSIVREALSQTP